VLVANHASYLDGPVLFAAIPAPVGYVVKGELEGNVFLAPLLHALGAVFVHRLDHERSLTDVALLTARLKRGEALGFFPEGTLHRMPGLLPFRLGAFSVAVDAEASVVPVTIAGSRSALRDGQWIPRPGTISVRIASPIAPVDWRSEEARAAASQESAVSPDEESPVDASVAAPGKPSRTPPDESGPSGRVSPGSRSWGRAVWLRDSTRAVILTQCGEPDLGARLDVLDELRSRKR
jgi:1-acyl-sn-glycerol-3-phosphate acyltransferase